MIEVVREENVLLNGYCDWGAWSNLLSRLRNETPTHRRKEQELRNLVKDGLNPAAPFTSLSISPALLESGESPLEKDWVAMMKDVIWKISTWLAFTMRI